ncbi:MAG: phosphate ABC transporter ATP-binding protein PstB [Candidatus Omnitrophica bacterium]|nr:phosphate ABC transporter ATP-binding protein PstB [Candidatus Omnitrophota bacterium]
MVDNPINIEVKDLNVWFKDIHALKGINLRIYKNEILSIIGPANSGKTSFLRTLNRLNDLTDGFRMTGKVIFDGKDIYSKDIDVNLLRIKIGMVFALPIPLPFSIFDNVAYGLQGRIKNNKEINQRVEKALKSAYLWEEVKDRLKESAYKLSGGQQQRLCIARTLALEPQVILFDEPCSGLDPISTAKIEEAMIRLKNDYTIILVTNNTKQAARVSDRTAFFLSGELIETDITNKIFTASMDKRTEDYITGRFG